MKNSQYWKERFLLIEEEKHKLSESYYKNVMEAFQQCNKELSDKLIIWYSRFADNNNIDLTEARKLLSSKQLEEFRWNVKDYIKYGKENAGGKDWMKQLENASARVHISRLEALKIDLQSIVEKFAVSQNQIITKAMEDVYSTTKFRSMYEIQKGLKSFFNIQKINKDVLNKVIREPWTSDGKTFSERIWKNKETMVQELQKHLVQNCITGKAPDNSIKDMASKFDVNVKQAGCLIRTESAYFYSRGQKDTFDDLGVKNFQFVATLDIKTSDICRAMDEKVFKMSDYQVGLNVPPLHCNCRSVTVPWFDDNFDLVDCRAYRSSGGKTEYTNDLNYEEWKEKHVKD